MEIGFIGLGAMGAVIVPRLMAAGHTVTGWNRSKEKAEALIAAGMHWGATPREVAAKFCPFVPGSFPSFADPVGVTKGPEDVTGLSD